VTERPSLPPSCAAPFGIFNVPGAWRRGGGRRPYCPQRPAQQTSQPVPPVQSELSRQWCGTHHLGPAPIAFARQVWMKRSLAGSASILCAASAQAICAWTSHCFTKLKRAEPASLCSVAFALQVWSAAAVLLITKAQSMNIRAKGCIRSRSRKSLVGLKFPAPKTILKSRSKDLRKRIRFLCENLYLSTDGANRQREPRMSQIPTDVWTNRMTTLSQLGQRNIAPMTPP
jgi:hypothetical protein